MKSTVSTNATIEWTESEAIARAQRGEAAAFEYLYRAHCRRVYDVCLRVTVDAADAEVLTEQVFLQLFRKIGTFRSESGFSTWVRRVALDIVLMHLNRHNPAEIAPDDLGCHSSGGEDPTELGSRDTSGLGTTDRFNQMRAIRKSSPGYRRFRSGRKPGCIFKRRSQLLQGLVNLCDFKVTTS